MARPVFFVIESIIYSFILILECDQLTPFPVFNSVYTPLSLGLKLAAIFLCLCFTVSRKKSGWLLPAFFMTFMADFCFLFLNQNLAGVVCFLCVQLFYGRFLNMPVKSETAAAAAGISGLLIFSGLNKIPVDATALVASAYFALLIYHVYSAFRLRSPVLAYSLIMLIVCDFHTGLLNLPMYIPVYSLTSIWGSLLPLWIYFSPIILWAFYLPAEILLASEGT